MMNARRTPSCVWYRHTKSHSKSLGDVSSTQSSCTCEIMTDHQILDTAARIGGLFGVRHGPLNVSISP